MEKITEIKNNTQEVILSPLGSEDGTEKLAEVVGMLFVFDRFFIFGLKV